MTADHPTREERYAAVLAEHEDVSMDVTTPREFTQYGGWNRNCQCGHPLPDGDAPDEVFYAAHRAHVAAALVAADPAPEALDAEPLARRLADAFPDSGDDCFDQSAYAGDPDMWESKAEDRAWYLRFAERLLAVDPAPTQPDTALSDPSLPHRVALAMLAVHDYPDADQVDDCTLKVARAAVAEVATFLAARAAQPVPAPEVSRGVAEVSRRLVLNIAEALYLRVMDATADTWTEWQYAPLGVREPYIAEADRIVRDALPTDDGADCCRERTTAGGCGCERSVRGGVVVSGRLWDDLRDSGDPMARFAAVVGDRAWELLIEADPAAIQSDDEELAAFESGVMAGMRAVVERLTIQDLAGLLAALDTEDQP